MFDNRIKVGSYIQYFDSLEGTRESRNRAIVLKIESHSNDVPIMWLLWDFDLVKNREFDIIDFYLCHDNWEWLYDCTKEELLTHKHPGVRKIGDDHKEYL